MEDIRRNNSGEIDDENRAKGINRDRMEDTREAVNGEIDDGNE